MRREARTETLGLFWGMETTGGGGGVDGFGRMYNKCERNVGFGSYGGGRADNKAE